MQKVAALALYATFSVCLRAQLPVVLGTAGNFAVLGGSTVTNTGPSNITGGLGVSPGTAVTGFPPGVITGVIHAADLTAAQAQVDLTTAFNDAGSRPTPTLLPLNIGGTTLTPGVYNAATSLGITGTVTFNGAGVYILQIPSTLTAASASQVILANGATAANIFWLVGSSATIGTNSAFNGTILAQTSITLTTGVSLTGRALARNGAVTMDTNLITLPPPPPPPPPPGTPAPSSLILVVIGLTCAALYQLRGQLGQSSRKL